MPERGTTRGAHSLLRSRKPVITDGARSQRELAVPGWSTTDDAESAQSDSVSVVETRLATDRAPLRARRRAAPRRATTLRARRGVLRPPKPARPAAVRRDTYYRRTLAAADAVAAVTALLLTRALVGAGNPALVTLAAVPLIVVMSKVVGIYDRQELLVRKSTLDEIPALFQLATLYALIVWLLNGFVITRSSNRRELLVEWALLFILLLIVHMAAREASRRLTEPERCLVIGDEAVCERIRLKLARRHWLHAVAVAYVPDGAERQRARGARSHARPRRPGSDRLRGSHRPNHHCSRECGRRGGAEPDSGRYGTRSEGECGAARAGGGRILGRVRRHRRSASALPTQPASQSLIAHGETSHGYHAGHAGPRCAQPALGPHRHRHQGRLGGLRSVPATARGPRW